MQSAEKMTTDRDDLIGEYRQFVISIVVKMSRYMNLPADLFDEFVAAGYLGLVEAAERFDAASGHEFKKFAYYRIRGAIIDSIRNSNHLSGEAYRCSRAMQAAVDLQEELRYLDKEPTVKPKTLQEAKLRLANLLDISAKGVLAFKMSLCEVKQEVEEIPDESLNLEENFIANENNEEFREILETLPENERFIIQEYYFKGKSFVQIVEEHGNMSKSWVSRLHSRALERIKNIYIARQA